MELLFSNFPPMRMPRQTFFSAFTDLFMASTEMDIAVGFITQESLGELYRLVEANQQTNLRLAIGMHYYDKFSRPEYNAAMHLNTFLRDNHRGEVRLVTPFRFHGKMYVGRNNGRTIGGIIGSNNLSGIIEHGPRVYEASILIDEERHAHQMDTFVSQLIATSTSNIADLEITNFKETNPVLNGHENVSRVPPQEQTRAHDNLIRELSFELPLSTTETAPGSNINACFGPGRLCRRNGLVKPRPWYEAEIIVPARIARRPGYPISDTPEAEFYVITDDGWKFPCKISGQNNKNFRSKDDLQILGKWLKGRLEDAGILQVGEPVTRAMLEAYGRDTVTLTKTAYNDYWYLDFEARR